MSMFDYLEISEKSKFVKDVYERDWQVNIKCQGVTYRINENMELVGKGMKIKDNLTEEQEKKLEENEYPSPDMLEEKWFKLEDYSGVLTPSSANGKINIDLVVENGDIVDWDNTYVRM